jgi:hypothetical protein
MTIGDAVKSGNPIRHSVPVGHNLYFEYEDSLHHSVTPFHPQSSTDQPLTLLPSGPTATIDPTTTVHEIGDYVPFKQSRLKGQVNPLQPPLHVETVLIGRALGQATGYLFGVGFRVLDGGHVEAEFLDSVQVFDSYETFKNEVADMLQELIGSSCPLCQQATIQQGKHFLPWTNDFLICPTCSTEFHRAGEKYILKNIPRNYDRWLPFEAQVLTNEEIQRIAGGGKSDAEIAADKAAKEESLRRSQIEGTPEYYYARCRQILGLPFDDSNNEMSFTAHSKDELKEQVARIKQMQNELKLVKKELNQQIKQKQVEVALRGYKRDAAANLKRLAAAP